MSVAFRSAGAATTGTTSCIPAIPAGIKAGDVLVTFLVDHATTGSTTAPTGWTRQGGAAGTGGRFQVFTKVATGTETAVTYSSLTTRAVGQCYAFIGVDNTTPMDVAPSARINASGTTGTTAITTVTNDAYIIGAFSALASNSTWTGPVASTAGSLINLGSAANSTFCNINVDATTWTSSGSTGNTSATMGTAGANGAILMALRPSTMVDTTTYTVVDHSNTGPAGTALTTANTGSSLSNIGSGATAVSTATDAVGLSGFAGLYTVPASNVASLFRYTLSGGGSQQIAFSVIMDPQSAISTSSRGFLQIRDPATTLCWSMRMTSTGTIQGISATSQVLETTETFAPGTRIRVEVNANLDTSILSFQVYDDTTGDALTAVYSKTAMNLGGMPYSVEVGVASIGTTGSWSLIVSNVRYNRNGSQIGPVPDVTILTDLSSAADTLALSWTIPSLAVGDIVVIAGTIEDWHDSGGTGTRTLTPTASGLTFTQQVNAGGSSPGAYIWTAVATVSATNLAVTAAYSGAADSHGGVLYVFPAAHGYSLATTPNTVNGSGTTAANIERTFTGIAGNVVVGCIAQWVDTDAPASYVGTVTDDGHGTGDGTDHYYWHQTLPSASSTIGVTNQSLYGYAIAAIEIQAPGGGSGGTTSSAVASLSFNATSSTNVPGSATASLSFTATESASGTSLATGSLAILGSSAARATPTITGSLSLTGSAIGTIRTTALAQLSLLGSGTSVIPMGASAVLALIASGAVRSPESASGGLSLLASSAIINNISGVAALSLSGSGSAKIPATGSAALALLVTIATNSPAASLASLILNGSSAVKSPVGASGLVTLSGSSSVRAAASAIASLTFSGLYIDQTLGSGLLSLSAQSAVRVPASVAASLGLLGVGAGSGKGSGFGALSLALSGAGTYPPSSATASLVLDGHVVPKAMVSSLGLLSLVASGAALPKFSATGSIGLSLTGIPVINLSMHALLQLAGTLKNTPKNVVYVWNGSAWVLGSVKLYVDGQWLSASLIRL